MLFSVVLTGCSEKSDEEAIADTQEKAAKNTVTLSMYLMSEEPVSEEQADKMETAINKITKSKFKTKLVLRYFTEDQYYTALEDAFKKTKDEKAAKKAAEQALKEAIKRGEATAAVTTTVDGTTAEPTVLNEYGVPELAYPTISDNQVDIFYVGGYDRIMDYIDRNYLEELDESLSSSSKTLSKYLAAETLRHSKTVAGATYFIPTNQVIGEYTYMLIHKDILKEYNHSIKDEDFTLLTNPAVQDILDMVDKYESDEYVPLYSTTGDALDISNIAYIGLDENGVYNNKIFSLIGGSYEETDRYGSANCYYPYLSLFEQRGFRSQAETLIGYKEKGYYQTPTDGKKFAVGYMKGSVEIPLQYEDEYEIIVVERPRLSERDLFTGGFAVSTDTADSSRCMDVITYLNTNVEFRNLVLYGIEGDNYAIVNKELDGEVYETVERLDNSYVMDVNKTGNTLIAYPLSSEPANIRELQKEHVNYARAELDIGFISICANADINLEAMEYVRNLSAEVYNIILSIETLDEWRYFFEGNSDPDDGIDDYVGFQNLWDKDKILYTMCNENYSPTEETYNPEEYGEGGSIVNTYLEWIKLIGVWTISSD